MLSFLKIEILIMLPSISFPFVLFFRISSCAICFIHKITHCTKRAFYIIVNSIWLTKYHYYCILQTNLNKGANILLLSFLTVVLPYFALIFPLVFIFKFNNNLFWSLSKRIKKLYCCHSLKSVVFLLFSDNWYRWHLDLWLYCSKWMQLMAFMFDYKTSA